MRDRAQEYPAHVQFQLYLGQLVVRQVKYIEGVDISQWAVEHSKNNNLCATTIIIINDLIIVIVNIYNIAQSYLHHQQLCHMINKQVWE